MTDKERIDYIQSTLKAFQDILPKTKDVVLSVNDTQLHQLSARTKITLNFLEELK